MAGPDGRDDRGKRCQLIAAEHEGMAVKIDGDGNSVAEQIADLLVAMRSRLCGYPQEVVVEALVELDEYEGFEISSKEVGHAYSALMTAANEFIEVLENWRNRKEC